MAASMRVPVVVVIGPTGSGKSKLALQIGKYFKGEIISVDSMQVYKGLDIVTNKVTPEEQSECPHHLFNYISPLKETYTVVDYRDAALPIIDGLLKRRQMPILCGGTNYYVESLLWHHLINQQDVSRAKSKSKRPLYAALPSACIRSEDKKSKWGDIDQCNSSNVKQNEDFVTRNILDTNRVISTPISAEKTAGSVNDLKEDVMEPQKSDISEEELLSGAEDSFNLSDHQEVEISEEKWQEHYDQCETSELYKHLMEVDQESAKRVHIKDRRKILGALRAFDRYNVTKSEILKEQKRSVGSESISGPLRYPDTCIFWVHSDQEVLDERTDRRVDKMMERGMIQEMLDFHQEYNKARMSENKEVDYSVGIFQSIGFKEFHQYLIMDPAERESEKGKQLLDKGVEDMKLVTRRYARRQVRWMTNRLLKRHGTNRPPIYRLDSTVVANWDDNVYLPAIEILTDIIHGREPRHKPLPYLENNHKSVYEVCQHCDKIFLWESEWQSHLKSRKHKGIVRKRNKEFKVTTQILDRVIQGQQEEVYKADICNTKDEVHDKPIDLTTQKDVADSDYV